MDHEVLMRRPLAMGVVALLLTFCLMGCGGSNNGQPSAPAQAARADRHLDQKLDRLERRVARLKRERRARTAAAKARAAEAAAGSGSTSSSESESASAGGHLGGLTALGRQLGGEVGATIGPPGAGKIVIGGDLETGSAWSTIKVPIALRVLEEVGGPSRLSAAQRDWIQRAITQSDNEAAAALFRVLERSKGGLIGASRAVTEILREAGDSKTVVSTQGRGPFSTYGQTEWALSRQQEFMAALAGGCISSPASRQYLLDLMRQVTSDTWGLGSLGANALWKGGWGPGIDGRYLVRQMGEIWVSGKPIVVTVAVIADDGSFTSAQNIATEVARRVAARAKSLVAGPGGC
jgi:hypothetical protein